jgi:hypothetical protein
MEANCYFLAICVLEYQLILSKIKLFDFQYPDNKEGFNALVSVAADILQRAEVAGYTKLDPLPERK